LIQDGRGCQIIPKDYFINKDLEYLKGGDSSRRYSTSVTKTKAESYDLKWIEDMVYDLWNLTSSKYVYSQRRIIAVIRIKIKRKYDYGYLEEIKDGIYADKEMESVRQEEGSGYGPEYRQAAVLEEVNA
nr:hypothetical protein [Tanacetum cinerariifolium]